MMDVLRRMGVYPLGVEWGGVRAEPDRVVWRRQARGLRTGLRAEAGYKEYFVTFNNGIPGKR